MGRKKFIFISIIILFTIQTSACSAEGQESQGIWHNEYESEIEISSTEEERKDVSENKNITFRVLDGKEISVSRDRLRDTERINNRWSLEETDAMIAPLKGTWTTDTYMGYALPYNLRKFEPDTYADEEARETFFGEYHEAIRAAEESPVPDISVEVQPVEEYEDGYTIRVNGYESPFSIILSTERINDEYPIYSDTTTLSESFFVEYPVVYIKLFARFKDGESDRYNPATVIVSAEQVDISAYFLENHGFDTKFNYDARQTGNVSGDVINEVYGWTNETTATYTVAGTFAYNPEVTFNNSSALPASGYEGSEGGALGLTTGWGMQLVYSQSVTLPKGTYRLSSAYYNVGTSGAGNSLLAWLPDNGTATVSDVKNFPVKSWKTDELIFTLTAQTTGKIRIGFAANEGVGSANHAKILVDYVKLLCDDMDKGGLETALSAARAAYGDGSGVYAEELKAAIDEAQTVYEDEHAAVTYILALTHRLT